MESFVKFPEDYNKKCIIQLSDTVGIRLKSPSFSKFRSVGTASKGLFDITDEFIFACVDCVYDGDKVLTPIADFTLKELSEFIESFPADKIDQISEFFANQPKVTLILNITCPKCRNKSVVELNGLKDFFD
jgi:predicted nucleic-acid-binding Zn-ribbon protein